jgi:hypothetical protein
MNAQRPNSPKLRRWHFQLLLWSLLALWVTGVAWLWLHYFQQVEGEFGPEPHPVEPWMLRLHGFFMLPAMLALGGIAVTHFVIGWRYKHKRVSGLVQAGLFLALILTGYALYYAGDETQRTIASITHWIIGAGAPIVFIWHLIVKARRP